MKRLIIDTDPGVDDTMAILLTLNSPELVIEGLTTVFGNVGVDLTTINALRILEAAKRDDIPVVSGAGKPLLRSYRGKGASAHGSDGFGETNLPLPNIHPANSRAAEFIISEVTKAMGEITLLALGPLTNLALAVSLEPSIAKNVRDVIIMGGVVFPPGNSSPVAESNIYNDPEAAKIVFNAGWPLTMVGLDVTRKVIMTSKYLAQFEKIDNPYASLISKIIPFYLNYYQQSQDIKGIFVHDSSAIAYALHPEWFKTQRVYVDIVIGDSIESGQTVADWRGQWELPPNVSVCTDVNANAILNLYINRLSSGSLNI